MPLIMTELHHHKELSSVRRARERRLAQAAARLGAPCVDLQALNDESLKRIEWLRRSLYGSVLSYERPFDPVAPDEWDASG